MNASIGTLKESSLHASLKARYVKPGEKTEVLVQRFHIDIVNERELIEIQTGNFSSIKSKLQVLLTDHAIRLIYPQMVDRWIIRVNQDMRVISRRKSPRKGRLVDIFDELIFIASLIPNPNLIFEVVLVQDELIYKDDGKGAWRRKGWSIYDRELLDIKGTRIFNQPSDFLELLPATLPETFTVEQLAVQGILKKRQASRMAYSLFHMGVLERICKAGNAWVYRINEKIY
jgi:hypothetical protein